MLEVYTHAIQPISFFLAARLIMSLTYSDVEPSAGGVRSRSSVCSFGKVSQIFRKQLRK